MWVDLGGQWAGPTQHHLLALLAEQGAPTFPTWTAGDNLVLVDGEARRYRGTIPRLGVGSLLDVGQAQWRLERMARFNDDRERVTMKVIPGAGHAVFTRHFVRDENGPTEDALRDLIDPRGRR